MKAQQESTQRRGGAAGKNQFWNPLFPPLSASQRAYLPFLPAAPLRRCEMILLPVELELTARLRSGVPKKYLAEIAETLGRNET